MALCRLKLNRPYFTCFAALSKRLHRRFSGPAAVRSPRTPRYIGQTEASPMFAAILTASASQAAHMAPLTMANNLTFSRAVMLPGITLTAGTYVFESGPGGTNPNIVRVMSQTRQKLYYLGFTNPIVRP